MTFHDWLTTTEIRAIFSEEIHAVGGRVTETIEAGFRIVRASVLPDARAVGKGDLVQGGVAVRATDQEILVHPYIFRQVCSNGEIRGHAVQTRQIVRADFAEFAGEEVAATVREAIHASCCQDAFAEGVDEMRSARLAEADLVLGLGPFLGADGPRGGRRAPQLDHGPAHRKPGSDAIRPDERRDLGRSRHPRPGAALAARGIRRRNPRCQFAQASQA